MVSKDKILYSLCSKELVASTHRNLVPRQSQCAEGTSDTSVTSQGFIYVDSGILRAHFQDDILCVSIDP